MTTSEWINTIVLTVTMLAVLWYAWEARKQSRASTDSAVETARMAREIEAQNRRMFRPLLDIKVETLGFGLEDSPYGDYANVFIKNVGPGPAIHVSVLQPGEPEYGVKDGPTVLTSIPPGQEIGPHAVVIEESRIAVTYRDVFNRPFTSSRTIEGEDGHGGWSWKAGPLNLEFRDEDAL